MTTPRVSIIDEWCVRQQLDCIIERQSSGAAQGMSRPYASTSMIVCDGLSFITLGRSVWSRCQMVRTIDNGKVVCRREL